MQHLSLTQTLAGDNPETKQWVDITRKLLAQSDEDILEQADNRMYYVTLQEIMTNLQQALPIDWTPDMQGELGKIIVESIQLFRAAAGSGSQVPRSYDRRRCPRW